MCDVVGGDMVEFTKTIKDPLGLHARPVALLYDIIAKHRSDVSVSIGDRHTDGRDVMGLMALYGECGEDIIFRVAFKPVATLLRDVNTIDKDGNSITLKARGRHDPCVLPRAVPIVEAMAAMVILDAYLLNKTTHL